MTAIKIPKKLIEVALPLDDINAAAAREKSIRHGHPSTLHLWWSRKPLAAARAVLFAQMVNDPGYQRELGHGVNKIEAEKKREELFQILRELVLWENTNNEKLLQRARACILESWKETCHLNRNHPEAATLFNPEKLPAFHDPFAGGGAIPLEAQRLGLESHASDLNPVAVMINKAMIEIPPKFAGSEPVGPVPIEDRQTRTEEIWKGAMGLAEDVLRYGHWMRERAFEKIGHLYPKVRITEEMVKGTPGKSEARPELRHLVDEELTVIAWLWARTVKSPNPAFSHVDVPLVSSFVLSSKAGKEVYVKPVVEGDTYRFEVKTGKPSEDAKNGTKLGRGANFSCLFSETPIDPKHIYSEAQAGRLGQRLMAVVTEGKQGRIYLSPIALHENIATGAVSSWSPETLMPENPRWFSPPMYGMKTYGELFTPRQLVALTTFSDLVQEAREKAIADAKAAGWKDDGTGLDAGGSDATAYGDALAVYLTFAVDRAADAWSSIASWTSQRDTLRNTFARQAIPMIWNYAEVNPFSASTGHFSGGLNWINKIIEILPAAITGYALQADASNQEISKHKIISSDPPYYDNIGYADLSDYFYVWMRRSLKPFFPSLFATLSVPKAEELVATPYRHGNKEKAENFFMEGMKRAIARLADQAHPAFPVTIYYAFKQSETKEGSTSSTGWITFLEAVLCAGFAIQGTWPMRTELERRLIGAGTNALASSIILVCRKRPENAESISRREFQRLLREEMPEALETMIGGKSGRNPIAPVDLAQSAIGPGMALFSRYQAVLTQDGSPMAVQDALILINQSITDFLTPDSGKSDPDTLFCAAWFDQYGWQSGAFGEADTLSRAKGTSVDGLKEAGVLDASSGKVRLFTWKEYPEDWNPKKDKRTPAWEACHQMVLCLKTKGESASAALLALMPEKGEAIRQLAYHLYTLCERKKWAEEAQAYNELITSWPTILEESHRIGHRRTQTEIEA